MIQEDVLAAIARFDEAVHVVRDHHGVRVSRDTAPGLVATLPAIRLEDLGDPAFMRTHRLRFPYMTGAMANGIASTDLVVAVARAGMLGSFGAAGLSFERVERALDTLQGTLGADVPYAVNLIHSPNEPTMEDRLVDLFLRRRVTTVESSAYMGLTPAVVRYALTGLRTASHGIERPFNLIAKVSRPEVARRFLSPAPLDMVQQLVARGLLTEREALLSRHVALAEDVTVEADSAGHTDNRPMAVLVPLMTQLRDELARTHDLQRLPRIGAAGGIGTPAAVAGAFALGAAYVVTGSINEASLEAGISPAAKDMLAKADIADVTMAPAADMFELGVKLQVLKRGTMFAVRAAKLWELYSAHESLEALPQVAREKLERDILGLPIDAVWADTRGFFMKRDPSQVERAEREPRHRMALVFRWYLGKASRWAIDGDPARRLDYQIWCGPAMGAFNAWTAGSFLAAPAARGVVDIARCLLEGAAAVTRAHQLRTAGVTVPPSAFTLPPRQLQGVA